MYLHLQQCCPWIKNANPKAKPETWWRIQKQDKFELFKLLLVQFDD